jgi:hypothetical protein
LLAILLIAIAPTVSQFRAVLRANAVGAHHHLASSDSSGAPCADEHAGGLPDDCWKKCGYCDFLHHTPAAGGINYHATFAAIDLVLPVARCIAGTAHSSYAQAAQPRGPPLFA